MPEIVIIDEIGTEEEALACRTIAERGVQLIGTAHGQLLENLIKNPTLSDLVGGICSVTLGDEEPRTRGTQKSVLERKAPPTFPLVVEMRERAYWVAHWVEDSVDCLLTGKVPIVQVRRREPVSKRVVVDECRYDATEDKQGEELAAAGGRSGRARAGVQARGWGPGPEPHSPTCSLPARLRRGAGHAQQRARRGRRRHQQQRLRRPLWHRRRQLWQQLCQRGALLGPLRRRQRRR